MNVNARNVTKTKRVTEKEDFYVFEMDLNALLNTLLGSYTQMAVFFFFN